MTPAEIPGASLGSYLRALREAKGGSLEDMARSTRVGIRHLEALEDERLADLPSPVFVRGFIRAYCGFLREAPEEALGHYEALAGERAAAQAASAPPDPRTTWASSSVLVGLALLVVLGIGLIVINLTVKRTGGTSVAAPKTDVSTSAPARAPAAAPAPSVEAPRPVAAAPAPTPAVAPPPSAPPSAPGPTPAAPVGTSGGGAQRLAVKAHDETWIRVQPDEGRPIEELLPAGASREWSAERRFLVTIGNAGGVELTLNGKILPPLGPKGAVIQRLELPQAPASGS
ncbi:MAG TPA: helix-turn-helix domain-containing protein [Methylomirabilota bacterium]|nr:helix-turn-helix domain-containing protein [Methylomirabilota bacterium]